jgi:hypothetical protein
MDETSGKVMDFHGLDAPFCNEEQTDRHSRGWINPVP